MALPPHKRSFYHRSLKALTPIQSSSDALFHPPSSNVFRIFYSVASNATFFHNFLLSQTIAPSGFSLRRHPLNRSSKR